MFPRQTPASCRAERSKPQARRTAPYAVCFVNNVKQTFSHFHFYHTGKGAAPSTDTYFIIPFITPPKQRKGCTSNKKILPCILEAYLKNERLSAELGNFLVFDRNRLHFSVRYAILYLYTPSIFVEEGEIQHEPQNCSRCTGIDDGSRFVRSARRRPAAGDLRPCRGNG